MRSRLFGSNRRFAAYLMLLVLVAYGLKALIPAGFMPVAGEGLAKIVICSGFGEKTIYVPQNEGEPAPKHKSDKICEFQVLASHKILTPQSPVLPPLPALVSLRQSFPVAAETPRYRLSAAIQARGPPASV